MLDVLWNAKAITAGPLKQRGIDVR